MENKEVSYIKTYDNKIINKTCKNKTCKNKTCKNKTCKNKYI